MLPSLSEMKGSDLLHKWPMYGARNVCQFKNTPPPLYEPSLMILKGKIKIITEWSFARLAKLLSLRLEEINKAMEKTKTELQNMDWKATQFYYVLLTPFTICSEKMGKSKVTRRAYTIILVVYQ
jgi:hypothetical protein